MRGFRIGVWIVGLAVLILPPTAHGQGVVADSSCITCHLESDDERLSRPAAVFDTDVHARAGLSCLDCHGRTHRDGTAGLAFLEKPDRRDIPRLCSTCHSDARYMRDFNPSLRVDQLEEYETSVHGQLLFSENDPDVATCNDCHPSHEIRPPSELESSVHPLNVAELCGGCHADAELMGPRGVETDQVEEYTSGVHGNLLYEEGDISAPTCNDCHGNHGAAPPGIFGVGNVCGSCHATMMEYFEGSGHAEYFEDAQLPGCATCHGNHAVQTVSDEFLVDRSEDTCSACHESGDASGEAFLEMKSLIDSLEVEREWSRMVLDSAQNLGMEVEEAVFELEEVSNALTKARTAIHTFALAPVQSEIESGLETTHETREMGFAALEEHSFRRVGLAISALIIVLLCLTLALKIRELESRAHDIMDQMEAFFESALGGGAEGAWHGSPEQIRLAACALLIELAYADETFSEDERDHLEDLIRTHFGLGYADAQAMIELAEQERAEGMDLKKFTALIRDHFDDEAKATLMQAMWKLVLSDGQLAERESYLIHQISREIGIDTALQTEPQAKED
jgi:uncharacterized tellurite resistance protein B-like protein